MIDRKQLEAIETANRMPINLAAAEWLRKTDWGANPGSLHCLSLMRWGLENDVRVPVMEDPALLLLNLEKRMGPVALTEMASEPLTLYQEVQTPTEMAALLLETLLNNLASKTGVPVQRAA